MAACHTINMTAHSKIIILRFISLLLFLISFSDGRIHNLKLQNDDRNKMTLSTFGLLKGGTLAVNISMFSSRTPQKIINNHTFGFTLDKSKSAGFSNYVEGIADCIWNKANPNLESVFFKFDFKNNRINIERNGKDMQDITIVTEVREQYLFDKYLDHGVNLKALKEAAEAEEAKKAKDKSVSSAGVDEGDKNTKDKIATSAGVDEGDKKTKDKTVSSAGVDEGDKKTKDKIVSSAGVDEGDKKTKDKTVSSAGVDEGDKKTKDKIVSSAGVDEGDKKTKDKTVSSAGVDEGDKKTKDKTVSSAGVDEGDKKTKDKTVSSAGVDEGDKKTKDKIASSADVDEVGQKKGQENDTKSRKTRAADNDKPPKESLAVAPPPRPPAGMRSTRDVKMEQKATAEVVTDSRDGKEETKKKDDKKPKPPATTAAPLVTSIEMKKTEVGSVPFYQAYFLVHVRSADEEGLYNLFFHNCLNVDSLINLTLQIIEDNNGNYLSADEMPIPALYFVFSVVFFILFCMWASVLRQAKEGVYKIHYLMLLVMFFKSLSCLFHGINMYMIQKNGIHIDAWAILWYIVYLTRGALMFVTVVLIGAGWAFIKHMFTDREKKLFLIVMPLQILENVAWVIVKESEEGTSSYNTWNQIFMGVDLLCCIAIIFPVIWSIRHLQEASRTDGKAAINLNKLKLFKFFYILVVCYIYFTRFIVYLLKILLPFRYGWMRNLFAEVFLLCFFTLTGFKFRPTSDNPYLQVPLDSDDEDIEMEEVMTKTGNMDSLSRVNQHRGEEDQGQTAMKQRESSHEYD